jgi:hypothetical protein
VITSVVEKSVEMDHGEKTSLFLPSLFCLMQKWLEKPHDLLIFGRYAQNLTGMCIMKIDNLIIDSLLSSTFQFPAHSI